MAFNVDIVAAAKGKGLSSAQAPPSTGTYAEVVVRRISLGGEFGAEDPWRSSTLTKFSCSSRARESPSSRGRKVL